MLPSVRPVEILLVEDNPGDILLAEEAFYEAKICNTVNIVNDGEDALAYLYKQGSFSDVVTPDLILLDLNLPKIDGREVLDEIKASPNLCDIPIAILTGSEAEQDILKTYDLHASSYVIKPFNLNQFIKIVNAVVDFRLSIMTVGD